MQPLYEFLKTIPPSFYLIIVLFPFLFLGNRSKKAEIGKAKWGNRGVLAKARRKAVKQMRK